MWIWFVLASAVTNILFSFMTTTQNYPSFFLFKVLPFFAGLGALLYFLIELGFI